MNIRDLSPRVLQTRRGGRGVLHGERPGAEEPRPAGPEHGGDLGAEEVMEDHQDHQDPKRPGDGRPADLLGAELRGPGGRQTS